MHPRADQHSKGPVIDAKANRRQFLQTAAFTGAAVWAGSPLIASAEQKTGGGQETRSNAQSGGSSEPVPLAPPEKQPPNLPVPEPAPGKVGWAVVGLGQLALEEVMPAFASVAFHVLSLS